MTRDNVYNPKYNWTLQVREHLNRSLVEEGLIRQSLLSKSALFISHPLPECSCRMKSVDSPSRVKGDDGKVLYGGEEECPEWMHHDQDIKPVVEEGNEDEKFPDYESNLVDQQQQSPELNTSNNTNASPIFDQDEEMDPND